MRKIALDATSSLIRSFALVLATLTVVGTGLVAQPTPNPRL
jgi:hypothetical protein